MTEILRTSSVAPVEGFDLWESAVSSTFVQLEVKPVGDEPFRGEVVSQSLGDVQVARVTADAHHVARTKRTIAQADCDQYKLSLQVRGYCRITQDSRETVLSPGDMTIYDCSRAYTLAFDDTFQQLVFMFPRARLTYSPEDMAKITATRVSGHHGMGSLVSPFLMQLAQTVDAGEISYNQRLSDNVIDLVTTMFGTHLDLPVIESETLSQSRLRTVQQWIERNLNSDRLDPESIAAANHISVRYVHKLFHDAGTSVSRWVKERRLERCRQDLLDPRLSHQTVSVIASRWGFYDAASFSRSFKQAYGASPREFRIQSTPSGPTAIEVVNLR